MIIVTATITAKPAKRDEIISKSHDLIKFTHLEPGCISYDLYASIEDEDVLIMLEQWENREVLEAHMKTEHFKMFGILIEEFVAKKIDIAIYSAEKV